MNPFHISLCIFSMVVAVFTISWQKSCSTPSLLLAGCPCCRPIDSVRAQIAKVSYSAYICSPQANLGVLPTLSVTNKSFWLLLGRVAEPPANPWTPVYPDNTTKRTGSISTCHSHTHQIYAISSSGSSFGNFTNHYFSSSLVSKRNMSLFRDSLWHTANLHGIPTTHCLLSDGK